MARSKDVYAVLGLLCVDPQFRNEFFTEPEVTAKKLVGTLTQDELAQVMRISGEGISGNRQEYVDDLTGALNGVYTKLRCPNFPCPDPDPFAR